jgi:pimeloyl-ACP methyl ester carboxylesterase
MAEKLIDIASPLGSLSGVLHVPDAGEDGCAVLMPPAGMSDRVGPARLYPRLARRLCDAGHFVLRYDGVGVGESDGYPPSIDRLRCLEAIENGERAGEIVASAERLERETGVNVVVVGLGAAAVQAAHLARLAPHLVAGVLAIGAPARKTRVGALPAHPPGWLAGDFPGSRIAASVRRYLGIAEPESVRASRWHELVKRVGRSSSPGSSPTPQTATLRAATPERIAARVAAEIALASDDVLRPTWQELLALRARGAPVTLVYGAGDPALAEYELALGGAHPDLDRALSRVVIAGASHAFVEPDAFEALASAALELLSGAALPRFVRLPPRSSQKPVSAAVARRKEASDE